MYVKMSSGQLCSLCVGSNMLTHILHWCTALTHILHWCTALTHILHWCTELTHVLHWCTPLYLMLHVPYLPVFICVLLVIYSRTISLWANVIIVLILSFLYLWSNPQWVNNLTPIQSMQQVQESIHKITKHNKTVRIFNVIYCTNLLTSSTDGTCIQAILHSCPTPSSELTRHHLMHSGIFMNK